MLFYLRVEVRIKQPNEPLLSIGLLVVKPQSSPIGYQRNAQQHNGKYWSPVHIEQIAHKNQKHLPSLVVLGRDEPIQTEDEGEEEPEVKRVKRHIDIIILSKISLLNFSVTMLEHI